MTEINIKWNDRPCHSAPFDGGLEPGEWNDLEEQNNKQAKVKVKKFIAGMEAEEPQTVKECRVRYLKNVIARLEVDILDAEIRYQINTEAGTPYADKLMEWCFDAVEKKQKEVDKLKMKLRFLIAGKEASDITPGMISLAKDFPIGSLLEMRRKDYAVCPYHDDHSGHFYIKNNWGYCFSCGTHADGIDLAMKTYNLNFPMAVKKLAGAVNAL